jgi:hypothetical protein
MVVLSSIVDIITGILKAHITNSYDSTIMKKGMYSKVINWFVMASTIGFEIGMSYLGNYYDCREMAAFAGTIAAGTVFLLLMLMEFISIFENFAIANPDSPLSKIIGRRLQKVQDTIVKDEEKEESEHSSSRKE